MAIRDCWGMSICFCCFIYEINVACRWSKAITAIRRTIMRSVFTDHCIALNCNVYRGKRLGIITITSRKIPTAITAAMPIMAKAFNENHQLD